VVEVLVVDVHELTEDSLKGLLEEALLGFELLLLRVNELLQGVEVLLNLGQNSCTDFLKFVGDLAVASLELVDLIEVVLALIAGLDDEGLSVAGPVEALDATVNALVEEIKLVGEEVSFTLVD